MSQPDGRRIVAEGEPSRPAEQPTLAREVGVGALWLVSARITTMALDLATMLVIARILLPADLGLVALATSVLFILTAVTEISLSEALVQMRAASKKAYDTAFTLNLIRGGLLSALMLAGAEPLAELFSDPRLSNILLVMAIAPVLAGLSSPRMASHLKEFRLDRVFALQVGGKCASFVAAIAVVLLTKSYWALVVAALTLPLINCILSYVLAPYRPALALTHRHAIVSFGGWIALSHALNNINWQADRFLAGGILGQAPLGQYVVGSQLASLPTNAPTIPLTQALFAGFSRYSDEHDRVRSMYLSSQSIIVALVLPLGLITSALARPIILATIGDKWEDAILVVQVVAPVLAIQTITGATHSVAMAMGRTRFIFNRDVIAFLVRIILICAGIYIAGFDGLVISRIFAGLFVVYLNIVLVRKLLGVSLVHQIMRPWRSYISALIMVIILIPASDAFLVYSGGDLILFCQVVALAVVALALYAGIHLAFWCLAGSPPGPERSALGLIRRQFRVAP